MDVHECGCKTDGEFVYHERSCMDKREAARKSRLAADAAFPGVLVVTVLLLFAVSFAAGVFVERGSHSCDARHDEAEQ